MSRSDDTLYKVTLRNLPYKQAQALYRMLIDLDDEEEFHGVRGMSWSGIIPNRSPNEPTRTVSIDPMPIPQENTK
jgi:hypothetical protein